MFSLSLSLSFSFSCYSFTFILVINSTKKYKQQATRNEGSLKSTLLITDSIPSLLSTGIRSPSDASWLTRYNGRHREYGEKQEGKRREKSGERLRERKFMFCNREQQM